MNEYQLLDLFDSYLNTTFTFFVSYISGTSAFLAVAYIAGKKLPSFAARLIIGLYSLASLFFLIAFQRNWTAVISIRGQMTDANLAWSPAVSEPQVFLRRCGYSSDACLPGDSDAPSAFGFRSSGYVFFCGTVFTLAYDRVAKFRSRPRHREG